MRQGVGGGLVWSASFRRQGDTTTPGFTLLLVCCLYERVFISFIKIEQCIKAAPEAPGALHYHSTHQQPLEEEEESVIAASDGPWV